MYNCGNSTVPRCFNTSGRGGQKDSRKCEDMKRAISVALNAA